MKSNKTHADKDTYNEQATRSKLMTDCIKRFGPEAGRQLRGLYAKWDNLIANCKNESEVKHMRRLACAEIFNALGYSGGLKVGEDIVIPAEDTGPKLIKAD
jgi:hypothetical protein